MTTPLTKEDENDKEKQVEMRNQQEYNPIVFLMPKSNETKGRRQSELVIENKSELDIEKLTTILDDNLTIISRAFDHQQVQKSTKLIVSFDTLQ